MGVKKLNEEKGMAFLLSILLLLVVTLIGISAVSTANYDIQISGNKKISEQAFYVAEAGLNEFFARFRDGATSQITDTAPTNANWRLFLALNTGEASKLGYSSSNANHVFTQSLQNSLGFAVQVQHKVNLAPPPNNVISLSGNPIYIVTANGFTPEGGNKVIQVELNQIPSPILDPPGALYSEQPVNIHGSSTYIQGMDQCGTNNKAGIVTTLSNLPADPISISGHPTIQGNPSKQYNATNLSLRNTVDSLKKVANFTYDYTGGQSLSGYSDQWGTPSASDTSTPIIYNGPMNIVYVNMHGNTLQLTGHSHGAGILLVDGNLDLHGGFTWYGLVIVMGAVDYTGGGQNNITGGVMCGETTTIQVDVGGNAGIIYCSAVANKLRNTIHISPLNITRWREIF